VEREEKTMKKLSVILTVLALVFVAGCCCTKGGKCPFGGKAGVAETAELCKGCGEVKGSEKCCKPAGRTKCAKCGLFKGSPGCCKMGK